MAQLQTIDIGRLYEQDKEEAAKLLKVVKEDGVFYLDLQHQKFVTMLDNATDIFALSKELFCLKEDEKMLFDIDKLSKLKLNGYKPVGRNVGDLQNKRDGFESYTIPGKAHLDLSFPRPSLLTSHLATITTFFTQVHSALSVILLSLSSSLELTSECSLTNLHRMDASSPDILRLLHYITQPEFETGSPQVAHTDLGSLTLLFTNSPGLQVWQPQHREWVFVNPKTNCAIVNIGDGACSSPLSTYVTSSLMPSTFDLWVAKTIGMRQLMSRVVPGLTMLTGGLLHSCLHRVSPVPGEAMKERYSIAYLQRAEDDVKMKALSKLNAVHGSTLQDNQDVYTSREWLEKKFGVLRRQALKEVGDAQGILTGNENIVPHLTSSAAVNGKA